MSSEKKLSTAERNKKRFGSSSDDSCVWNYFDYEEISNQSKCKVCLTSIKGKVPANMIKHLGLHPEEYESFAREEHKRAPTTVNKKRLAKFNGSDCRPSGSRSASKRAADGSFINFEVVASQCLESQMFEGKGMRKKFPSSKAKDDLSDLMNLDEAESFISGSIPDIESTTMSLSERRKKFKQILVEMVTMTSVPAYIADNEIFRKLVLFLDPRMHILSRETLVREVQKTYKSVKDEMRQLIATAHKVTIGADICEKKTVTCGMVAVTAYFYDIISKRRMILTLGLKDMKSSNNPEETKVVLDSVLKDYGVQKKQIHRFMVGTGGKLNAAETEILTEEEEGNEASIYLNVHFCDQNPEACGTECFANTFRVISNGLQSKKMNCFVTVLDSVWKPFEKKSVFDPSVAIASKLVQSLKRVGANINYLLDDDGKSIKVPRRWVPMFSKIQHLVRSIDTINSICDEEKLTKIDEYHWSQLKKYVELLAPFKLIRDQQDSKTECTISRVVPAYIFLERHLTSLLQTNVQDTEVFQSANHLLQDLKSKLSYVFNPQDPSYDEIYIVATFLDPSVHRLLSIEQIELATNYIRNLALEIGASEDEEELLEKDGCDDVVGDDDVDAFEKFLNSTSSKVQPSSKIDKELIDYTEFLQRKSVAPKTDPLDFWADHEFAHSCPTLKKLSFDILSIPSTANDIEQIFVAAGHASEGRRNRISTDNLESRVMLKMNANFLTCFAD